MALQLTGPGFSTELESAPAAVQISGGEIGQLGFCFSDFAFEEAGGATVWVDGAQIGACLAPRGVSIGDGADRRELDRDTIITRGPDTVSTSRWRDGFHGRFLAYAPEAIERFFHMPLSRIRFDDDMLETIDERPAIAHLLAALASDLASGSPNGQSFVESLGAAALRSIVELPSDGRRAARGLTSEQAKALRDLVHARLSEALSLVDLANEVSLSVGHMLRAFRQTFGVTPHQYILRERVDYAMRLLETRSMSLDEVAEESGFGTRAQMTRRFRAVLGVLPKDVR